MGAEREMLRQAQDYAQADKIRDLLSDQGIKLNDRQKIWWSMDGVPDSIAVYAHQNKSRQREGEDSRTWRALDRPYYLEQAKADVLTIQQCLLERDDYRKTKSFDDADRILEQLKDMNIVIDDGRKTWRIGRTQEGGAPSRNWD